MLTANTSGHFRRLGINSTSNTSVELNPPSSVPSAQKQHRAARHTVLATQSSGEMCPVTEL
jgi:hypothetical protein